MNWNSETVNLDMDFITSHAPVFHEPKSFLITGATGMLLKYLPEAILRMKIPNDKGTHRVYLLTRNVNLTSKVFYHLQKNRNLEFIPLKRGWQNEINQPIDIVVHGAGAGSPNQVHSTQEEIISPNISLTKDLLDYSRMQKISAFILISSGIVYGSNQGLRKVDEQDISETPNVGNLGVYQMAKQNSEKLGMDYFSQFGVPIKILRPAHCYGPTSNLLNDRRLASYLIGSAIYKRSVSFSGNDLCMRSFVYIADALVGLFQITVKGSPGEAYNLFSSKDFVDVNTFLTVLAKYVDNLEIHKTGKSSVREGLYMTPEKLETLGWRPKFNLSEGINRTIKHFLA